jgi:hypothetical protein
MDMPSAKEGLNIQATGEPAMSVEILHIVLACVFLLVWMLVGSILAHQVKHDL